MGRDTTTLPPPAYGGYPRPMSGAPAQIQTPLVRPNFPPQVSAGPMPMARPGIPMQPGIGTAVMGPPRMPIPTQPMQRFR